MKLAPLTSSILLSLTIFAGCATPSAESTAQSEDKLIGLGSPLSFHNRDLAGRWEPHDPANFDGPAKSIEFSMDGQGGRTYRLGPACSENCPPPNGTWDIDGVGIIAGYWVHLRASGGTEKHLFVWNRADTGEIRLVDMDTWDWSDFEYHNTWAKNPALTVDNL